MNEVKKYQDILNEKWLEVARVSGLMIDNFWEYRLIKDIFKNDNVEDNISEYSLVGLYQVLDTLEPREKDFLILRYRDMLTLKEIGATADRSTERARQIIAKALRKLSHPRRSRYIKRVPGEKIEKLVSSNGKENMRIKELQESVDALKSNSISTLNLIVSTHDTLCENGFKTIGDVIATFYDDPSSILNILNKEQCMEVDMKIVAALKNIGIDVVNK